MKDLRLAFQAEFATKHLDRKTVFINPKGDRSIDGAKLRGTDGDRTERELLANVGATEIQLGLETARAVYSDTVSRPVQLGNALRIARSNARRSDMETLRRELRRR